MNSLVKDLLNTKTINEINNIKKEFVSFEQQFEKILDIFENDTTKDFIDNFIKDIHKYDEIKMNLEKYLQNEIFSIVNKNTKFLNETKNNIDRLSENFIDKFYYTVLFILVLTVVFILILSIKVNKNVVMSFEQIEDEVNKGLEEIRSLNNEIENTQKEVVFTMGSIGENRSKETGNHVKRVAEYSKLLALKYGLDKKEAELLKQASPMHDIGKVAIPDSILNKPGRFDDNERK